MRTVQVNQHATGNLAAVKDAPQTKAFDKDPETHGFRKLGERLAEHWGTRFVAKVLDQRELVRKELNAVPARMQQLTNQAALVLELIEDFRNKRYRAVPWHSIAVAAAALLYAVNPTDVVPDVLPGIGLLDDIIVLSLAMRLMRRDLRAYIEFKGYEPSKYF